MHFVCLYCTCVLEINFSSSSFFYTCVKHNNTKLWLNTAAVTQYFRLVSAYIWAWSLSHSWALAVQVLSVLSGLCSSHCASAVHVPDKLIVFQLVALYYHHRRRRRRLWTQAKCLCVRISCNLLLLHTTYHIHVLPITIGDYRRHVHARSVPGRPIAGWLAEWPVVWSVKS